MPNAMGQVLRLYMHMFPHYGLYVCINVETAQQRITLGIFYHIIQNTTLEENSQKNIPYFFTNCRFYLMGRSRTFLDKDQISSEDGSRKGMMGLWGEKPKMRVILQNSHY